MPDAVVRRRLIEEFVEAFERGEIQVTITYVNHVAADNLDARNSLVGTELAARPRFDRGTPTVVFQSRIEEE